MDRMIEPLQKQEVIKAVEKKYPSRIPLVRAKWRGEGLEEQYRKRLNDFDKYPEDVAWIFIDNPASAGKMKLSWDFSRNTSHDSICVIDDWNKLDEFIEKLPDPKNDSQLEKGYEITKNVKSENRYLMFGWWRLFFEMPWGLRGMQNLMIDYYENPDKVKKLHQALCDTYYQYIEYAKLNFNMDGFWTSDDLGHQTGPMMGPQIFEELIFPFYQIIGNLLKNKKVHFWLHSCGDNTLLMPFLIKAGLTVFHPVQKYAMDEKMISQKFGDQLTFLAGFDVQHILQEKDPEGVKQEVRFLIDTFDKPQGGLCLAAGNGIVSGTPFENIEAFLAESISYGIEHRKKYNRK